MNELEALQAKWAERDRQLEQSLALNRRLLVAVAFDRARPAMARFAVGQGGEAALSVLAVLWIGSFNYAERGDLRYLLPGIGIQLYAVALLAFGLIQIGMARIDPSEPVAVAQSRLERLRILRIRTTQAILLSAPLAWGLLVLVMPRELVGLDVYRHFPLGWLLGNILFGLAFIPAALWLARKFNDRFAGSPFMRNLLRDIAGQSLTKAQDFLATLEEPEEY